MGIWLSKRTNVVNWRKSLTIRPIVKKKIRKKYWRCPYNPFNEKELLRIDYSCSDRLNINTKWRPNLWFNKFLLINKI